MDEPARPQGAGHLQRLLDARARFLGFLARRVGDPGTAEDVLHAAYARALERADALHDPERVVAWFYRLLRNVLADHHRREGARRRALERARSQAAPAPADERFDPGLKDAVCACVGAVLGHLAPDQAELLRRAEIEEEAVGAIAESLGISPGATAVRLTRARAALRARLVDLCGACASHGCLACQCRAAPRPDGAPEGTV